MLARLAKLVATAANGTVRRGRVPRDKSAAAVVAAAATKPWSWESERGRGVGLGVRGARCVATVHAGAAGPGFEDRTVVA